jgi:dUTP pyrophosphatase
MILKYTQTHRLAQPPYFATEGAACFDIVAASCKTSGPRSRIYGTGLAFNIQEGYHIEVYIRSGLAFKSDFILANGTGIIDSDYTGDVMCKLVYIGDGNPDWPWVGDRIAQARLVRNTKTELKETNGRKQTERGEGGFGSTGR